jgi:hypothetical protein
MLVLLKIATTLFYCIVKPGKLRSGYSCMSTPRPSFFEVQSMLTHNDQNCAVILAAMTRVSGLTNMAAQREFADWTPDAD